MFIAEIGSVHDGSFGNACKLIEAAAKSGADAVKFQTHIAEAESLENAPAPSYFNTEPRRAYFKRTSFTLEQWKKLSECASNNGVQFLSSPFSLEAVDLLEEINVAIYKIPSGEVTNHRLLERVAQTKKPVLLSSGMSNWFELDQAVKILKAGGPLTVMQCSSLYPCPPEQVGLNILVEMRQRYGLPVGFSDHTMGYAASIAAVALGATVIEKHFTFSRLMYGSDARHSMEPEEFRILASCLKEVWQMLKNPVDKNNLKLFEDMKNIFQKSIVTSCNVSAGTVFTLNHLSFKKPGTGIGAERYKNILGKKALHDLPKDHLLREEDFI